MRVEVQVQVEVKVRIEVKLRAEVKVRVQLKVILHEVAGLASVPASSRFGRVRGLAGPRSSQSVEPYSILRKLCFQISCVTVIGSGSSCSHTTSAYSPL